MSKARRGGLWRSLARDAYIVASVTFIVIILMGAVGQGVDGRAYWLARLPDPYGASIYGLQDGYYYSPVFAQLLAPFVLLPWPVFHALVVAMSLASLYWLVGRWALPALLLPPVAIELYAANITLPLAVAIVVGLRWPAAWAAVLLTKVSPGVGVVWFAARAEWRALAIAIGATLAVAGLSFVMAPSIWLEWLEILRNSADRPPLPNSVAVPLVPRLVVAVGLVVLGARTARAWLIPVATVLATPVIWPATFALLLAIPRLRGSWNPDRPSLRQKAEPEQNLRSDSPGGTGPDSPGVPVTERTTGT